MRINYNKADNNTLVDTDKIENIPKYAYQWFMKNDQEVLYVLKDEILIGLMTIGDVFRYYEGITEQVVNNCYTALQYGEIGKAETFFENHWTIHELPVVDLQGHLIGIYSIKDNNHNRDRLRIRLENAYSGKNQWLKEQLEKWSVNCSATVFGVQLPTEEETLKLLKPKARREFGCRSGSTPLDIMRKFTEEEQRLYWGQRYSPGIVDRYIKEFSNIKITSENGIIRYGNLQGEFFTFQGGHRVLPDKPNRISSSRKIYLVGPCTVFGAYVCDGQTIEAYLQQYIENDEYEVINCGEFGPDGGLPYLFTEEIRSDDIVVISFSDESNAWKDFFMERKNYWGNWSDLYMELENPLACILDNFRHVNYKVNQIIARRIFEQLSKAKEEVGIAKKKLPCITQPIQNYYIGWDIVYSIKQLANENRFKHNKTAGAIVMNCNPFTYGHRFLIETAMQQVEALYIFVVEEDKSVFPFADRFEMVKQGVADLKGEICVLPSGKYIISKDTFSQYFEKDKEIEEIVNMDFDLHIFGEVVCREFGISKRFAGEEPSDVVTRAYNEAMARILPQYQVEFVEIPRKKLPDGEFISATKARYLLSCGEWGALSKLLPATTLRILQREKSNAIEESFLKYI